MPQTWVEGTMVHIYKNKGEIDECISYRPICLTQIAYKIWPHLIAKKLATIMQIITNRTQYGYKTNLPTIYAIVKIESHPQNTTPNTDLLLIDLTKAIGKVNRTIL